MNADMKWLDNPEVFRVNQLDAHSDHCYYMDYADMEKSENPLMQSLNGQWEFAFSKNVMDRPENFYEENFDASSFDKIMVPGHIELAGYDKIRYINTMYPWEGKEYHRGAYSMESTGDEAGMFSEAEYNPVGSYIKRFDLSEQMREKKIRICFEGVEEAMYLWLNGQFVGYAEDSFTPSEFDLTPFIREKGNVLAVQVHKMSTAAFLEDQDFFRFFGIFRNVTLKAVPEVHLEDVWFQPTLNKDNISGRVSVKMKVSAPEGKKVSAHLVLKDRENNQVAEDNITLEEKAGSLVGVIDTEVGSVKAWDNYCPYLYHAYVELRGEDGEILEIPKKMQLDHGDIGVLYGNLVDNAVEACSKVSEEQRFVKIENKYQSGILLLVITNSKTGKKNKSLKTTKKDNIRHGHGVQSVRKVVEKYNGTVSFTDKGDIFEVSAMLYGIEVKE